MRRVILKDAAVTNGSVYSTNLQATSSTLHVQVTGAACTFSVQAGVLGGGILDTLTLADGSTSVTVAAGENKVIAISPALAEVGIKVTASTASTRVTFAVAAER